MLVMFTAHKGEDEMVAEKVSALLKDENRYIANHALKYLETLEKPGEKVERVIEKFRDNKL